MKILSVDTSSKKISYSISEDDKLIYEYNRVIGRGASCLAAKIRETFQKLSLSASDFDFFVAGAGPGSFTGLRISFSLVKAFAFVTGKPVFSPGSFFACAYPFRGKAEKIAVIADAKKNLIYGEFFDSSGLHLCRESGPQLMELADCLKKRKRYLFITYDAHLRLTALKTDSGLNFVSREVYPKAKYLVHQIKGKLSPESGVNLQNLEPLYLHPLDCQVEKTKYRPKKI